MSDLSPNQALGIDPSGDLAKQLYGYMGALLDDPTLNDPDTGVNVLREAAVGGWDQTMLQGALYKTDWWQTSSSSKRDFDVKWNSDRASILQQQSGIVSQLDQELMKQGISLPQNRLQEIALMSLQYGWDDTQMRAHLHAELQRSPDLLQSKVGTDYKAQAADYGVPMSEQALGKWASDAVSGTGSDEQFREYLQLQAQSMYSDNKQMQTWLGQGKTVSTIFDPYRQVAARTLGVDPNSLDLTDSKWMAALQSRDPADPTKVRPMTLQEWDRYLRTEDSYGYSRSQQGLADYGSFISKLGQTFGVAPGVS
jgi:hypothetical protein